MRGISCLTLPKTDEEEALESLKLEASDKRILDKKSIPLIDKICRFCQGQPITFDDNLDLSAINEFSRNVLSLCRTIPYGQTRHYGWIAEQLGKKGAVRAVGNALHRNPLPLIIPCHRVIAANGSLGGFATDLEVKRILLSLEGVRLHT